MKNNEKLKWILFESVYCLKNALYEDHGNELHVLVSSHCHNVFSFGRDGVGIFLPALSAIYENMLPVLSTGFIALGNLSHPLSSTESLEAVGVNQVKRLKSRIVKLSWDILEACFLQTEEEGIIQLVDFPSLGGTGEVVKAVRDPEAKGALLVQAAISMTQVLGERDVEGSPSYFVASDRGKQLGALLRIIGKRHRLCEVVHERCQSGE